MRLWLLFTDFEIISEFDDFILKFEIFPFLLVEKRLFIIKLICHDLQIIL